jgi:putative peptidoglycan lipid II flippase
VLKPAPGWRRLLMQILSATVLMCVFLWWLAGDTARWNEMDAWQRVRWMSLLVAGGAAIYFGTLWLLGLRPADLRVRSLAATEGTSDGTGPRSS